MEMLVVISIMAVLAGLLMPALFRVREQGRRAVCMNNLRQIGIGLNIYYGDYQGFYPSSPGEYANLYKLGYLDNPKVFWCPSDSDPPPQEIDQTTINTSYNFNLALNDERIWSGEVSTAYVWVGCDLTPVGKRNHGKDGGNVLFLDGSVNWKKFAPDGNYQGIEY